MKKQQEVEKGMSKGMGNRRGKIKRMNKKDSEVEEEIGVAAIAKVERMKLFGRLKRPKLRRTEHDLSSSS